jgi:hypothetical protein
VSKYLDRDKLCRVAAKAVEAELDATYEGPPLWVRYEVEVRIISTAPALPMPDEENSR